MAEMSGGDHWIDCLALVLFVDFNLCESAHNRHSDGFFNERLWAQKGLCQP